MWAGGQWPGAVPVLMIGGRSCSGAFFPVRFSLWLGSGRGVGAVAWGGCERAWIAKNGQAR